jgi:Nickel responsive protein SCO4226-like
MRKFMIERDIPGVGKLDSCGLAEAARKSNGVLAELGAGIQWQQSFVTGDKTFCVYLAEGEEVIRKHAEKSGFPATRITEITDVIDPSTALR